MGTSGGMVTYYDGDWKLAVRYLPGFPREISDDGRPDTAVDEQIYSFAIVTPSPQIRTVLAQEFGKVMTIKARFVPLTEIQVGDTTHFKELCSYPFNKVPLIEVVSVDGRALDKPVRMECQISTERLKPVQGKFYELMAYETIATEGRPWDWNTPPRHVGYRVFSKLVVTVVEHKPE